MTHFAVHLKLTQHTKSTVCVCVFSRSVLSNSLWPHRLYCQAPLPMGFLSPEHWSGLPCPPPGHLPEPGTEPAFPAVFALAGGFFTTVLPGNQVYSNKNV